MHSVMKYPKPLYPNLFHHLSRPSIHQSNHNEQLERDDVGSEGGDPEGGDSDL